MCMHISIYPYVYIYTHQVIYSNIHLANYQNKENKEKGEKVRNIAYVKGDLPKSVAY